MMMKKVYCLYRVSTLGQVEKDDIPMQKQACHEFIAEHADWQFYNERSEKGVSGFKVSAAKRDVLQEIQHEAMQGMFNVLLVFMFDRLGRKDDETPFVVEWFDRQGVEVWSVKEGQQKFESHVDKLTNYIRYWQASGESIKTSIRTKTRLGQIVQEGRFRGGGVPFGYRIERQGRLNKKNQEVYEILINECESSVVKTIFDMYANKGFGTQVLATQLTAQGVVNRAGKNFHPASILIILKKPTYLGILRSSESQSEPFKHLRLIDDITWRRAQELVRQRYANKK
jgi:DNA invertase Pin-like site-specific DNA recombinase